MQTNFLRNKIDVIEIDLAQSFSAEALTYFNQLDPLPDFDVLQQLAAFIDGLVEDGIYAKIDEMWMFAMNDSNNALKGIKNNKACSLVNSPSFEVYRGFTGNGSNAAINTNYIPNADGVNWGDETEGSFGFYSRTDLGSSGVSRTEMGCNSGATAFAQIRTWVNTTNSRISINEDETGLSGTRGGDTIKFRLVTRTDIDTKCFYYRNGVELFNSAATGVTRPNVSMHILAMNDNGTVNRHSTIQASFAFVGGNLTADEVLSFNTRLEYFLEYIGASVPGGGETLSIPVGTYKFISQDTPIQILNRYYGYKPLIKNVNDIPAEIKEKDTVTRRLKVSFVDTLEMFNPNSSTNMASFWRVFAAKHKNFRNQNIRYYRRIGEGELELRFVGKTDKMQIDSKGNATIEAIDLMKAMSKQEYPFVSAISLAEDLPAIYPLDINTWPDDIIQLSDAVEGDYAKTEGGNLTMQAFPAIGGSLPIGEYYFWVVAYKNAGVKAINSTPVKKVIISTGGVQKIVLDWTTSPNATSYRVFGITENLELLISTQTTTHYDYDGGSFPASSLPENVNNWLQLKVGGVYSNLADWEEVFDDTNNPEFTVDVEGDTSLLNDSGYVKVDDEVISYEHILTDSDGVSLYGLERGLFGTESSRHFEGTFIQYIIAQSDPIDIFDMMLVIMQMAGIDEDYIGDSFATYAALNILNVTCEAIIDGAKNLAQIFFDLVNLADAMAYQDEDGLIQVKLHSDPPDEEITLTDEANLIYGSVAIDLNDDSRYSRWVLYWNRFDLTADLDDSNGYGRGNITIDGDAEDFYGDINQDKQFTAFLNGADESDLSAASVYANDLLNQRRIRTREAQTLLSASLEIKDDNIKLGQIVYIKTRNVLDEDGSIPTLTYRVIKKEPSGNRIKFTFIRLIKDSTDES